MILKKRELLNGLAATSVLCSLLAVPAASAAAAATFADAVQPFIAKNCQGCHNARLASAGLNLEALNSTSSIEKHRERWERIVSRIQAGEMPPSGVPRPEAQASLAMLNWVNADFQRQDRATVANPGSVVARRLNRNEYTNTIRDPFGVAVHANEEFPALRMVLDEMPIDIVFCPKAIGDTICYPAASIERDFAWAPANPVVDAYRAFHAMPYDAPGFDLAAILYAVQSEKGYFGLSDPGTVSAGNDGTMRFATGGRGKVRSLILDPAKHNQIVDMLVAVATLEPVTAPERVRPGAAAVKAASTSPIVKTP